MPIVNITASFKTSPQDLVKLSDSKHVFKRRQTLKRKRCVNSFKQVIINKPNSRIVFLVYASGKCVCLGTKSEEELFEACDWFSETFQTKKEGPPRPTNFVYNYKSPHGKVPLESLFKVLSAKQGKRYFGQFDPELSPALIYQPSAVDGVKALIFRPGSVNITGLKSREAIAPVLEELEYILDPGYLTSSVANN
jgi:TATA-box binding protein (TBP) (component of TFIID and TFIIIB)